MYEGNQCYQTLGDIQFCPFKGYLLEVCVQLF